MLQLLLKIFGWSFEEGIPIRRGELTPFETTPENEKEQKLLCHSERSEESRIWRLWVELRGGYSNSKGWEYPLRYYPY